MALSEHPAEKKLHDNRGLKKIIFEKALTNFGTVIWSSPRWHHCQAEMISSESLKTSVSRLRKPWIYGFAVKQIFESPIRILP